MDENSGQKTIAVLTEIRENDDKEPSFGNIHAFCEELNQLVTKARGLFYVFSLKGISQKTIHGFRFDEDKWVKTELPFPQIIYNRIHSRKTESGKKYAAFLQKMKELNITVFNERFLSKWEVHQWLSQQKNLLRYLPETSLFSEPNLAKLIDEYDELYLKPVTGSQGRGIIWLTSHDKHIEKVSANHDGLVQELFTSQTELFQALKKLNYRPYLIQQGIPLLQHEGKRIDFRVLCHRTTNQQWKVTSNVARLSAENHFASNVALGGEILRPHQALVPFMGTRSAQSKLELMKELALECANCIAERIQCSVGELGIDIGVDEDGELWLIEVNSKPSKQTEKRSGTIRPSAKAIFEYCTYCIENRSEGEKSWEL
ncbi:YheC/YheD family protein [Bacillus sp. B15-48]|uniref:YheC/YheD family endospore coat-associated protein n=1 Tax=Bacillus sp. B15-48 TaxID=1548601 RepID=UPI00193F33ED|nr:YheC/YheD family protein [Bacillus sp. B15-48]